MLVLRSAARFFRRPPFCCWPIAVTVFSLPVGTDDGLVLPVLVEHGSRSGGRALLAVCVMD
jgi:hypothetical protein